MVSWCGHEELCINHSSLQLSVSSHTANAHWEWGDVSSSHTSRCRELSPPTAMGTLIICSCWIGKLHYSVPGNVLSIIMTAVWIVRPGFSSAQDSLWTESACVPPTPCHHWLVLHPETGTGTEYPEELWIYWTLGPHWIFETLLQITLQNMCWCAWKISVWG